MTWQELLKKIDIDRLEFYLILALVFCFIGAACFSVGLAFLLCGVILLLVFFVGISITRPRIGTGNNGTTSNN